MVDRLKRELAAARRYIAALEKEVAFYKSKDYQPGMELPEEIRTELQAANRAVESSNRRAVADGEVFDSLETDTSGSGQSSYQNPLARGRSTEDELRDMDSDYDQREEEGLQSIERVEELRAEIDRLEEQ